VFAGVRKIIQCVNPDEKPQDGTEVSYSSFELNDLEDFKKLVRGDPVQILYEE
jgi:hypothetical protein